MTKDELLNRIDVYVSDEKLAKFLKEGVEAYSVSSNGSKPIVSGSLPTNEHLKFAEWCILNGVTTYYNEEDSERFIDDSKEIFLDISQIYDKFKRQ